MRSVRYVAGGWQWLRDIIVTFGSVYKPANLEIEFSVSAYLATHYSFIINNAAVARRSVWSYVCTISFATCPLDLVWQELSRIHFNRFSWLSHDSRTEDIQSTRYYCAVICQRSCGELYKSTVNLTTIKKEPKLFNLTVPSTPVKPVHVPLRSHFPEQRLKIQTSHLLPTLNTPRRRTPESQVGHVQSK